MSSQNVTLRQLIAFQPENDREKEIYNIRRYSLDDMNKHLLDNRYYLGGQIKMQYDDEINLELFDKVREIDRKRQAEYGSPCNSWEAMSINNSKMLLEETEQVVKKYFEVIHSRESEIK
jgi:hypothetical protein